MELVLGLQTKAGVFKFNIANGNSENQDFNFSNTKIHIKSFFQILRKPNNSLTIQLKKN